MSVPGEQPASPGKWDFSVGSSLCYYCANTLILFFCHQHSCSTDQLVMENVQVCSLPCIAPVKQQCALCSCLILLTSRVKKKIIMVPLKYFSLGIVGCVLLLLFVYFCFHFNLSDFFFLIIFFVFIPDTKLGAFFLEGWNHASCQVFTCCWEVGPQEAMVLWKELAMPWCPVPSPYQKPYSSATLKPEGTWSEAANKPA